MSHRALFDIPADVAYFNAAYYSPLLNESRRRLIESAGAKSRPWERTTASFFDDAETIRTLASDLLGGDRDGYAVVPAASYAVSTVARALEPTFERGDRILVVADEFPSNVLPWRRVCGETGAEIVTVPAPPDGNWTRAILPMIDARVKVVAMSQCHWTNGARIDLVAVGAAARTNGSVLVVDATQSLGVMPFPIAEIQPDFLIAAAYKWMLCPYGLALMYVAPAWRDARPLEESWLARDNAHDFTSLADYSDRYMPGARRFDGGEKATNNLPGAIAALEQMKAWGVDAISHALGTINKGLGQKLEALGFRLLPESQRCPHLLGATLPAAIGESSARTLVADLRAEKIYISQRGQSLRFAPHMYVDDADVDRLVESLSSLVSRR